MFLSKLENTIFIRCKNLNRQETKVVLYWDSMKCPKKHAKDIFFTWWHMHIFVPYSNTFSFFLFSVRNLNTCQFFEYIKMGQFKKLCISDKWDFPCFVPRKLVRLRYHWKWFFELYNLSYSDWNFIPWVQNCEKSRNLT